MESDAHDDANIRTLAFVCLCFFLPCRARAQILVRGPLVAGLSSEAVWFSTGDRGSFRSNGTLVVHQDGARSQIVDVPTLSANYPSSGSKSRIGAGEVPTTSRVTAPLSMLALSLLALCACAAIPATHAALPGAAAGDGAAVGGARSFEGLAAYANHPSVRLAKRASSSGANDTMRDVAKMGMMACQRASWEQGTAQSALLELDAGSYSVFAGSSAPPYVPGHLNVGDRSDAPSSVLSLAFHSIVSQDSVGRLASRVTGDENVTMGSALDSASAGEGALLGAWSVGEIENATPAPSGFWM